MESTSAPGVESDNAGVGSSLSVPGRGEDGRVRSNVKTINLSGDQVVVTDELPGVYCEGVQYFDLRNVSFINYAGMANLIEFLKSLLEKGVDVRFVNVNEKIKRKIKSIGLEHIINCI